MWPVGQGGGASGGISRMSYLVCVSATAVARNGFVSGRVEMMVSGLFPFVSA